MFLLAWLVGSATATPPVPTLAPSNHDTEERVLVKIRARQFEPTMVTLHAGQKTRLVFQNYDAELHAFVPDSAVAAVRCIEPFGRSPASQPAGVAHFGS